MTPLPLRWRFRSTLACIIIPVFVNVLSFNRVVTSLGSKLPRHQAQFDDKTLADWVTAFLLRLPDPWYPTCLRRGAVLYYLLRRAGRPVQLCLGVQRDEAGAIDAHAWLTHNDKPHLEPPTTHPGQYKLIARFPEVPTGADDRALKPTEV